ncbi:uncharacterized protein CEXT_719821 [Caerostris extrusa]|uniref:Uncharacterized protein n=1 Tax=Caerostris extrusa TaxID=172846 RepID=A0AAV4QP35_CAEEX|nr:uncharacterized protein CEXT_719821 [Caerostris extrusa]
MDSDKSNTEGPKNRVGDSSADRTQAQRTVSAPFGQWLSTSMDQLAKKASPSLNRQQCLTPARSLSPIPSCASSNVPTPRSSITGTARPNRVSERFNPWQPNPTRTNEQGVWH